MERLQIQDRAGAAEVEEVLAHTAIASSAALSACAMCEPVFNADAGAQTQTADGGCRGLAQTLLERLVGDAMETVRPLPGAASVQSTRSGQASQAAPENCATEPRRIGSVSPAGQVMVMAVRSMAKSPLLSRSRIARHPG